MVSWGLVATVKAAEDQLLAFTAYHLSLGAERVWLYFDDPDDPALTRMASVPRVTVVRCTSWYWAMRGGRPPLHQTRQMLNARHAQRRCRLDWLGHIDVDEFLHAPQPVADVLAAVPPEVPNILMEPFEAMHDPDLADDIFTARHFRGPLHRQYQDLQPAVLGPSAPFLPKGTLGHGLGKSFCRPTAKGVELLHHLVSVNGQKSRPTFHASLRILHFHAQDPAAWRAALPFRLQRGAYNHASDQPLKAHLDGASNAVIDDFYRHAMVLTPEKVALLQTNDRLITADLGLRAKVADLLAGRL